MDPEAEGPLGTQKGETDLVEDYLKLGGPIRALLLHPFQKRTPPPLA